MRRYIFPAVLLLLGVIALLAGISLLNTLRLLALLTFAYFLSRIFRWLRKKILWKVRNKLILSHFFIGAIPMVLIVILNLIVVFVLIAGFTNLILHHWVDEQLRLLKIAASWGKGIPEGVKVIEPGPPSRPNLANELALLSDEFSGVVVKGQKSYLGYWSRACGRLLLKPLDEEVARRLREEFGFYVNFFPFIVKVIGSGKEISLKLTTPRESRPAKLKRATFMFPFGLLNRDVYNADSKRTEDGVLFIVSADFSSLVNVIFKGKDIFSSQLFKALIVVALFFSFLNLVAIFMGVLLVLQITSAVRQLSKATERLQAGDFSYRIPVKREDELGFLAKSFNNMAESIARLIEKEKLASVLEDELRIARKIQMRLLPGNVQVEKLEVAGVTIPAKEVGGDFYDIIKREEAAYFMMADVSGKGVSAALYAAMLKGIISSLTLLTENVREILIKANQLLSPHLRPYSFITLSLARIEGYRMIYARAGHQPAVFYRPFEGARILKPSGLGIGVGSQEEFISNLEVSELELQRGDVITFFTDGLSELRVGENMFGTERIAELVKKSAHFPAEHILEKILKEASRFYGDTHPEDDIALLVVRVK